MNITSWTITDRGDIFVSWSGAFR